MIRRPPRYTHCESSAASDVYKRQAKILCEIKGYGMSSDAYHYTLPDSSGDGAYRAMNNSIEDANLLPNEIQYINAQGTSTPAGDKAEALACLLYTSDAADDSQCVDLGGRRIIKKIFFFKQKTAYEIGLSLVGSEMCIRDRCIMVCI